MSEPARSTTEAIRAGRSCLANRDYNAALTAFDEALRQAPDDVEALAGRGEALFALDQFQRSVDDFARAITLQPDRPELWLGRAKAYFENNNNEAAIADCDEALRLHPDHAEVIAFRGASYLCLGDHDIGYDDLVRAIQLDTNLAFGHFFYGRALAEEDDMDGALVAYDTSIRLDQHNPWPYSWRANVWQAWGDQDRSMADHDEALRRKPNANGFHSRAHQWQNAAEFDKALADFAQAIRLEPKSARHYSCRSNLWASLGEYDHAYDDHEQARLIQESAIEEDLMSPTAENRLMIYNLIQEHLGGAALEMVEVTERNFPPRVAADLQMALQKLSEIGHEVCNFYAVHQCNQPPGGFTQLYTRDRRNPPLPVPPQYIEVDIGEAEPVRCLKFGLWLLRSEGVNYLALLDTVHHYQHVHFQVAAAKGPEGQAASQRFFTHLEDAIKKADCYRGKVLSLEQQESYNGQAIGICVHKLRTVERDQVILPRPTLDLLDRNVVQFVKQRPRLNELGLATKKGLLFYGPPGTGKTHTIHYLSRSMQGQTTFLISAEQVGMLGEYMTLARLMQPSMIVIEDVDLIARDRTTMHSPGEEVLLNKLLNEMDGLKPESDILFVLTTNRPEKLEEALAARPGRIDQAIEFPLPDADGRAKLVSLYAKGMNVPESVAQAVVRKTEHVSASFIKELMRRATQYYLERDGTGAMELRDVENALEEMLFSGGSLNRALLGAGGHPVGFHVKEAT